MKSLLAFAAIVMLAIGPVGCGGGSSSSTSSPSSPITRAILLVTQTSVGRVGLSPSPGYLLRLSLPVEIRVTNNTACNLGVCTATCSGGLVKCGNSCADLTNNPDSPNAGAITAALFLERFVEKAKSFAHFDIAAWTDRAKPGRPLGGESQAIRTLFAMLKARYS